MSLMMNKQLLDFSVVVIWSEMLPRAPGSKELGLKLEVRGCLEAVHYASGVWLEKS